MKTKKKQKKNSHTKKKNKERPIDSIEWPPEKSMIRHDLSQTEWSRMLYYDQKLKQTKFKIELLKQLKETQKITIALHVTVKNEKKNFTFYKFEDDCVLHPGSQLTHTLELPFEKEYLSIHQCWLHIKQIDDVSFFGCHIIYFFVFFVLFCFFCFRDLSFTNEKTKQ